MQGRPLTALLTQGPFLEAFAADFSPAQVAKWRPRPPAVCAHAAAAAFLLPHKGPRGCPGSGGTVRKISSAVAVVASINRDFLPALAPADLVAVLGLTRLSQRHLHIALTLDLKTKTFHLK